VSRVHVLDILQVDRVHLEYALNDAVRTINESIVKPLPLPRLHPNDALHVSDCRYMPPLERVQLGQLCRGLDQAAPKLQVAISLTSGPRARGLSSKFWTVGERSAQEAQRPENLSAATNMFRFRSCETDQPGFRAGFCGPG
jgi:hypothetical protein